jgi:hypothetical protein
MYIILRKRCKESSGHNWSYQNLEKNLSTWWPPCEEITNFLLGGHQIKKIIKEGKTYPLSGHQVET